MLMTGQTSIKEVLAFPTVRPLDRQHRDDYEDKHREPIDFSDW